MENASRAGSRMVSADYQTALIRDEQIKAELRMEADLKMLHLIQNSSLLEDSDGHAPESMKTAKRGSLKLKPIIRANSTGGDMTIDDNVEFRLGLSRNIQNQTLTMHMLPSDEKRSGKRGRGKQSKAEKGEAELSLAVTRAIAARELELKRLQVETKDLNRTYMGLDEHPGGGGDPEAGRRLLYLGLETLYSQMAVLRRATVNVAEALGAWARFVLLERRRSAERAKSDAAMGMSWDPRTGRNSFQTLCKILSVSPSRDGDTVTGRRIS